MADNEQQTDGRKPPMTWRRQVKRLAVLAVGAYLALAFVAAFFSERLLFHPHRAGYADSAEIIKLTTADGTTISARHIVNPAAKFTVIYSHGNGEDMADCREVYDVIHRAGFSVLAYDYHGYGTSGGSPTERNSYADIDAAYEYLTGKAGVPPQRIILLGKSIGSGPSADLAARRPVAGLILESAFVSAFRVPLRVPLLPWDKFENLSKLSSVTCPIMVIHGEDDLLIPIWHGRRLYEAAPGPKHCLWVPRAGHNDLIYAAGARYELALQDFAGLIDGH